MENKNNNLEYCRLLMKMELLEIDLPFNKMVEYIKISSGKAEVLLVDIVRTFFELIHPTYPKVWLDPIHTNTGNNQELIINIAQQAKACLKNALISTTTTLYNMRINNPMAQKFRAVFKLNKVRASTVLNNWHIGLESDSLVWLCLAYLYHREIVEKTGDGFEFFRTLTTHTHNIHKDHSNSINSRLSYYDEDVIDILLKVQYIWGENKRLFKEAAFKKLDGELVTLFFSSVPKSLSLHHPDEELPEPLPDPMIFHPWEYLDLESGGVLGDTVV